VTKEREKENVLLKQQWLLSEFDDVVLFLPFHRVGQQWRQEVEVVEALSCCYMHTQDSQIECLVLCLCLNGARHDLLKKEKKIFMGRKSVYGLIPNSTFLSASILHKTVRHNHT